MAEPERILETQLVHVAAPAAAAPPERRFTVGGVVSKTLRAWWSRLPLFTLTSLVVYAPFTGSFVVLWGLLTGGEQPETAPGAPQLAKLGIVFLGAWALTVALAVIQAGAVTYATVRHLNGERARLGEMLGVGLRRALPVAASGLLVWLAVVGASLLLVVPGLVLLVATSVAMPAAVVERPGALGAFRRSLALTRGQRWPLFASGLAVLGVVWALAAAVQVGATVVASLLLPPAQAMAGTLVAGQLGNALLAPIPVVAIAVAYHDLRVAKEGVDTAALARVFE